MLDKSFIHFLLYQKSRQMHSFGSNGGDSMGFTRSKRVHHPPQTCKEKSHLKERIDRTRFNRLYQTNPIHFFFFNPLFFSRCKHIQWTLGDHRSLKRGVKSQKGFTVSKKFNKLFFSFSLIDNGQFMVKGII